MLATENLTKSFGSACPAVAGVSLRVENGEIVFLLGANGAGKSTTINMMLDFVTPDAGRAFVDAIHVQSSPLLAKARVAYLPDVVALYESLSSLQNLVHFAALHGRMIDDATARSCLGSAGVGVGMHSLPVRTLSKGTRQKVALAISSARQCTNIILDEPTSGLDPLAARALMEQLRTLADKGTAILMCTHDVFRARDFASRVLIMSRGRIVAEFAERADFSEMEAGYLRAVAASEVMT